MLCVQVSAADPDRGRVCQDAGVLHVARRARHPRLRPGREQHPIRRPAQEHLHHTEQVQEEHSEVQGRAWVINEPSRSLNFHDHLLLVASAYYYQRFHI